MKTRLYQGLAVLRRNLERSGRLAPGTERPSGAADGETRMTETFQCGNNAALVGYLYDDCEAHERTAIAAHVTVCAACAAELAALRSTRGPARRMEPARRGARTSLPNVRRRRLNRWSSNGEASPSARTGSPGRFPRGRRWQRPRLCSQSACCCGIAQGTNGVGSPRNVTVASAQPDRRRMYRKHRWQPSNVVSATRWRPFESRTRKP